MKDRVRQARKSFSAIAVSYFMGLFNDNFYKEAALIIAVTQNRMSIQAAAAAIFTICYMLAAAPGGWLADRFAKGHVIIAAKAVELTAMIVGAFGIWTGSWPTVLAMIGIMGAQSAIFSPAMNGSIPELYPSEHVQTANTVVRVISTAAIFIGMALAGYIMDIQGCVIDHMPMGVLFTGVFVLIAAVTGFIVSFGAPRIPPHPPKAGFPWNGPVESINELGKIRNDRLLSVCVLGNIYIWSIASIITLLMVNLGLNQLKLTASLTAGMKIIFLFGVAAGGLLSNIIAKGPRFFKVFVPTYYIMAVFLVFIGITPYIIKGPAAGWVITFLIALTGIAGGVDLVPLESFIQIRPPADEKGRVIAAANFGVFAGITLSACALFICNILFKPTTSIGILGILTAGYGLWLSGRVKKAKDDICKI